MSACEEMTYLKEHCRILRISTSFILYTRVCHQDHPFGRESMSWGDRGLSVVLKEQ